MEEKGPTVQHESLTPVHPVISVWVFKVIEVLLPRLDIYQQNTNPAFFSSEFQFIPVVPIGGFILVS